MRAHLWGPWILCISLVVTPFLFSQASNNPPVVRVQEENLKLLTGPEAKLQLSLLNNSPQAVSAHIHLELVREDNRILDSKDLDSAIPSGIHAMVVPWSPQLSLSSVSELYWQRLHYRITPGPGNLFAPQEGTIQLGRIIPTVLALEAVSIRHAKPGSVVPVRVHVWNARTGKGISGAMVEARLDENDSKSVSIHPARTNGKGYALLNVKLPPEADSDSDIQVTARQGDASVSTSLRLDLQNHSTLTLSTDKPIYQPGQTLHMRVLSLGPDNHAAADKKVRFSVEDEDEQQQFAQGAITSPFGIASVDWEIPAKAVSGDYLVKVDLEDGQGLDGAVIRISRYELPQFTVNPVTDQSYYLPGQQPHLEVAATYLFGQPVTRGTVRIVRDNDHHWNSQKKQDEADQSELMQGTLDKTGKFSSALDVQSDFEELADSDYQRYRDIRFAAYVTDLSTNRTEQKHFTVRISKQKIHLYVVNAPRISAGPLDLYLSACYPDGTPARAELTVSAVKPDENGNFPDKLSDWIRLPLGQVRTNHYGLAHFHAESLPHGLIAADSAYSEIRLLMEAADAHGGHGVHNEQLWTRNDEYLRIRPLKRLMLDGENIAADIESSASDPTLFVELLGRDVVLNSAEVQLHHGRGHVEFPYAGEFRGSLRIIAYSMNARAQGQDDNQLADAAEVLFPEPQDLNLGVHLDHPTYKPGESASAQFRVRGPDGRAAKTALGIVVYDKAVAERVRSDQEFGTYGFYYRYDWDSYPAIAGVTYHDLLNQKLTGRVAPDWELLAEAVLSANDDRNAWEMIREEDDTLSRYPWNVFRGVIDLTLEPVILVLRQNYTQTRLYPATPQEFRSLLASHNVDFDSLRDPWGMPYRLRFSVSEQNAVLEIVSNGPDKLPDSADDFTAKQFAWPFFSAVGVVMDSALSEYTLNSGKYIRDFGALEQQLQQRGIDLTALRDPWGHPYSYKFEIEGPRYVINVLSPGPGNPSHARRHPSEFVAWQSAIQYFSRESTTIDAALADYFRRKARFPATETELRPILESAGLSAESLVDPWGNPYHFEFNQASRYSNQVDISFYSEQQERKIVPVTQQLDWIHVFSYGPTNDPRAKFEVANFNQLIAEQSSQDLVAKPVAQLPSTGSSGAVSGTVTDPSGAVIPGAKVVANDEFTDAQYTATCDSNGFYLLRNLPAGRYRITVMSQGFKSSVIAAVPVTSSNITTLDIKLSVGESLETVEVTAAAPLVETTTNASTTAVKENGIVKIQAERQAFTPRLRKYFPETLLWKPELVTDSSGKAQLTFAMADNITTWKMSVVASTANGQVGLAEKELRTFQPFFIDHEPPKILTQGDQIELPVVLRNYLNKSQEVEVKLGQSSWFSVLTAAQQRVSVPAGEDATARFLISADHSIREGKERVTAANRQTGDAVEHTLAVHPDGQDVAQTVASFTSEPRTTLELKIPDNAIPGSVDAELKIYANLGGQVLDSIHGMVARPAGCGEQITSIAFGSLLALQILHKAGQDGPRQSGNPNAALAALARRYVNDAYQQLLTLQNSNGGFPYWLHDEPDIALTAYILDFLAQASQFIQIDRPVLRRARDFLVSSQGQDGAWYRKYYDGKRSKDDNLTSLIARSLIAVTRLDGEKSADDPAALKALDYLKSHVATWKDPYLVGEYALAAAQSGRADDLDSARRLLSGLAHHQDGGVYWNLEANTTPFYGWGLAGRLETTGLAVQALVRIAETSHNDHDQELVNQGLIFLLSHKDRYGVWYSTQASVSVLRAIIAAMPAYHDSGEATVAELNINGKPAGQLHLPPASQVSGPVLAEISKLLTSGSNQIEVVLPKSGLPLEVQITATHYLPWSDSQSTKNPGINTGDSRSLRLNVAFDRTQGEVGKSIQCSVQAERIGFPGYGMMLAEIGLSPGADVDRESLQRVLTSYSITQYDVLPDRVILYIWPKAGGSKFSFNFKPRFAMNASAAPSVLYDYYNPDARATVAPARFVVH